MAENNRLKELLNYLIENRFVRNQEEFAQLTGIIKSTISQLCSGKRELNEHYVRKICKQFPFVNQEWLLEGVGEMLLATEPSPASSAGGDVVTMPREVFEQITKLTETVLSQQRTIETLANEIKKEAAPTGDAAKCAAVG